MPKVYKKFKELKNLKKVNKSKKGKKEKYMDPTEQFEKTKEDFEKGKYTYYKETEAEKKDMDFGLKIVIDQEVYQKVMYWVNKAPGEVSGLGKVIFEPQTNSLRIVEAVMAKQKNTGGSTDLDAADIAKIMYQLRNTPGDLRWWWHSHVNMNVFWSGTDLDTIKQLGAGGWFCATVFNKRNEVKSAFCQKDPVRLFVPEIPTHLAPFANKTLTDKWDKEYDEKIVKEERWAHSSGYFRQGEWISKYEQEKKEKDLETSAKAAGGELKEDEYEIEEIHDDNGRIICYRRVKKGTKVPVRSLKEVNESLQNTKPGQESLKGQEEEKDEKLNLSEVLGEYGDINQWLKDIDNPDDPESKERLRALMDKFGGND